MSVRKKIPASSKEEIRDHLLSFYGGKNGGGEKEKLGKDGDEVS